MLVDCRSEAEWAFVGLPDLSAVGKSVARIPWQSFPTMEQNPAFADQVSRAIPDTGAPVLFICRSGGRSRAAAMAMTARGFDKCYNVSSGFEGDLDADRHRGTSNGWKADGLPWTQS